MHPSHEAISMLDNLVYDGCEILWNVSSEIHTDQQDPLFGWATLCVFGGNYQGGEIYFPNVGLHICMQPGDIVFLKGHVIFHLIKEWTGGQHISVPHFTHTSTWKMVAELADQLGADEGELRDDWVFLAWDLHYYLLCT